MNSNDFKQNAQNMNENLGGGGRLTKNDFNLVNLKELYSQLEDNLSKKIFLARVNFSITADEKNFCSEFEYNDIDFLSLINQDKNIEQVGRYDINFSPLLSKDETIVFYGAGQYLKEVYARFTNYFSDFVISDINYSKLKELNGQRIVSPDELFANYKNNKIIITVTQNIERIYNYLIENGIKKENIFIVFRYYPNINVRFEDADSFRSNISQVDEYNFLLTQNIDFNNLILHSFNHVKVQYFDKDIIKYTDNEVFVDCGSCDGTTSLIFKRICTTDNPKCLLLEPEDYLYEKISKNKILLDELTNYELYNVGTWDKNEVLKFSMDGCGHVSDDGTIEIKVDKLDNIIKEKVTFIKMDIEGAELSSLIGAEETIKKYKPKLAIAIYHKPEDVLTIQSYIKSIVPEYKIYLRHYSITNIETVLYAVID